MKRLNTLAALAAATAFGFGCASTPEPAPAPAPEPAAAVEPEPAPASAPAPTVIAPVKEGHVTITDDHLEIDDVVRFETGKAVLAKESFELLDDIVKVMKGHSEIAVLHVIGHTDATGDRAANVTLSDARAKAVVDYLRKQGVTQSIDARGAGPDEPLCTEQTADCNTKNRRVEFKIEKT